MSDQTPVIEIHNLHKAYGALEVIKGVDITAHKGDVVSLIGSSGSGKSTILRCANLLEDSQQGDIIFKGEPVTWKGTGLNRHPGDPKQVLRIRTERGEQGCQVPASHPEFQSFGQRMTHRGNFERCLR